MNTPNNTLVPDNHPAAAHSAGVPPFSLGDADFMRRLYPWITLDDVAKVVEIVKALRGISIEWCPPPGDCSSPSSMVSTYNSAATAVCLREAYEQAAGVSLRLWFTDTPHVIGYTVKSHDSKTPQAESRVPLSSESASNETAKVEPPASAPAATPVATPAKDQTIEDVIALYPGLGATTAIKLLRIVEGLAGSPVEWVSAKLSIAYSAHVPIDAKTVVDDVVRTIRRICESDGSSDGVLMTMRCMTGGSWIMHYGIKKVVRACSMVCAAEEIRRACRCLDPNASITAGQVDALLADIPHSWEPIGTGHRIRLDGASVARIVSDIRHHYSEALAAEPIHHHVRLCCEIDAELSAHIKYAVYPH